MSLSHRDLVLLAIVLAGLVGTLLNAAAVAIFVSPDRLALALLPGRYLVAILLCLPLPLLISRVRGAAFLIFGTLWLTLAASVLAKFLFGVGAPWPMVLGFNLVYAIGAIVTYRIVSAGSARAQ